MQKTLKERFAPVGAFIKDFAGKNYLMIGYIIAVVLLELTGIAVTAGKFYMTEPWLYLTLIALVCFVSFYLPGHTSRYVLFIAALVGNFVLDVMFIVIFDSTGTIFDFAMFNLRRDAMTIVESIPVSFAYVFVSSTVIALYCTLGHLLKKSMPVPDRKRSTVIATSVLLSCTLGANVLISCITNSKSQSNDLSYKLYQTETGTYSNKGLVGNFYNELIRGLWFSDIQVDDLNELNDFIYEHETVQTPYFGKARDEQGIYNVVTVLCESFEWFTFLYDAERYPYGYARMLLENESKVAKFDADTLVAALRKMYPNLYRFYEDDSTVILNNSHSLEKTDISENKSIIGNYPLYEYINYSYPTNTIPYSLPNILNTLYGVESNSFHDGYKTFYNRYEHHTNALGFKSFTAVEDMGINDDDTGLGERNLDSQMMEACKTRMFPTDKPFNTYITTITQHGQYAYRETLEPYYAIMDELGVMPLSDNEHSNAVRYYLAAGMDFDKAIGIMLDYLDETGLADRTLITLFGDHNCYYQGISNYVKDIFSDSADNYTELYRVPVMIRVGGNALGNPVINKFTCVADILPTILDLLGIVGFSNLMYGVSAFSPQSSVLYSRAYDKFITDKLYFNSINHIVYKADDVTDEYIKDVEQKALVLLDKISHTNRLFACDFFKTRKDDFNARLRDANILA
ncbi:MAG: sulfatase-like hydrolase/transferase [Clostridia bacterium]|jgi:phosphoglycerol transferase MdoB-like AlkP superfamily enzyme|nr:sulfatase-like hydrolase/transferase [Clostridia bacterium]